MSSETGHSREHPYFPAKVVAVEGGWEVRVNNKRVSGVFNTKTVANVWAAGWLTCALYMKDAAG